ncbi:MULTISPECIES: DNA methyltransferase [unclassified Bradyrhizobium]|uniref:site-specific DNA-methyltransferase n=2 Tax=unclassified Bradyrhizobium TaxID=2631580 RepID=UPI00025D1BE7|nr:MULTISPECIES: DNA methyltransferase [unclassified Bradyrhizobium]EIG56961.1 DNA modification methylase [Bradyrhizobium sp. WSM1253]
MKKQLTNGAALRHNLNPVLVPIGELRPLGHQTRRHPQSQIEKLAASLREFGFVLPIIVDATRRVVAGWAMVLAAKLLGLDVVPAVTIVDLGEAQLRVLKLTLNRLVEDASWDVQALRLELTELLTLDPQIDLQLTGFSTGELDVAVSDPDDLEDDLPPPESGPAITQPGDLWILGEHYLRCGDARQAESYGRLLEHAQARMIFADPPYNVPIDGHASGLGRIKHPDFVMGSGELSAAEFEALLTEVFAHVSQHASDGSIHYICSDWRAMQALLNATRPLYSELKNLCIWNKSNGGMGSLYRSKHELVFVFKKGRAPHVNNVHLGRHGRNRSNVWDYPSQNTRTNSSKSKLSLHPTVKPVALVADAIRDCTNEHDIVLDPFGGAGTTLIAAERTRRRARLIEIDPAYVDVTIQRWQHLTGKTAVHAETGEPFGQRSTASLERARG